MDNLSNDFLPLLSISKEKAERNVTDAENYLRLDFKNIAEILSAYHPLELVKMCVWEERRIGRIQKNEETLRSYRLLPVLVQSILSSSMYERRSSNRDVREKDWLRLVNLGQDVSRKLCRFLDNRAALEFLKGNTDEKGASDYREALYRQFFPESKDKKKLEEEKLMAHTSLEGEEEIVSSFFGMKVDEFINGLSSIAYESLEGIDRLSQESAAFRSEVLLRMAKLKAEEGGESLDDEQLKMKVYKDVSIYQQALRLEGQRDGFDLFRPEFCSNMSAKALDKLSVETGSLNFENYFFSKGLWISTVFPFLKVGDMFFSFVGKYILSCAQRVASETLNLHSRITAATYRALSWLFTETDVVGVYSFDGNKIDISVLESLLDINAYAFSQQWFLRRLARIEDEKVRPQLGHKLIFVDPDGDEKLMKMDENTFSTSVVELLNVKNNDTRSDFFTTILGEYTDVEPSPYSDIFESDEVVNDEVHAEDDQDLPESELEDFDDTDYLQEDEAEQDALSDEEDPRLASSSCPISEDEKSRYLETYEDNQDIIEEELGKAVDNTQYDGVDDDEYDDEEDYPDSGYEEDEDMDLDVDDEVETEEEELKEEAAIEDDEDPDQLNFMDILDEEEGQSERIEPDFSFAIPDEDAVDVTECDASSLLKEDSSMSEPVIQDDLSSPDLPDAQAGIAGKVYEPSFGPEVEETAGGDIPFVKTSEADISGEDALDEDALEEDALNKDTLNEDTLDEDTLDEDTLDEDSVDEVPDARPEEKVDGFAAKTDTPSYVGETGEKIFTLTKADVDLNRGKIKIEEQPYEENVKDEKASVSFDGHGLTIDLENPRYSETIRQIVSLLGNKAGVFAKFLEQEDRSVLDYFNNVLHQMWEKQCQDGKDKMFSIFEYDLSVLLSKGKVHDELRDMELMNNAGAVMYSKGKNVWNALVLYINKDYVVETAEMKSISRNYFSASNWKIVSVIGEELIARGRG